MEHHSPIKILDKALRILMLFSSEAPEWGITELAARVGMPKSTVFRVLKVLASHEFLVQDPLTRRFRLGLGALQLGHRAYEGLELRQAALPVLNRIAALTGETVTLQVLNQEHDRVVCIERAQRQSGLRLIMEVGNTAPLHAGSSSKALLAFLPEERIATLIARGLRALTPETIVDPERLRRDLAETRARGYAISFGETDDGTTGISVPIFDGRGDVIASLTIAGPATRLNHSVIPRCIELAREGVRQIAQDLGFRYLSRESGIMNGESWPAPYPAHDARLTAHATRRSS